MRGSDGAGNATVRNATVTIAPPRTVPSGPPAPPTPPRPCAAKALRVTLTPLACAKRLKRKAFQRKRASASAWRTLRGTVEGGRGTARVEIAVARKVKRGRPAVLRGSAFRPATRAVVERTTQRAARRGATWLLRLPRLAVGTYLLRIGAVDGRGKRSAVLSKTLTVR